MRNQLILTKLEDDIVTKKMILNKICIYKSVDNNF
jgi:hypothetical protein